ncbi:MAG: hypothetical protein K0S14_2613, partial [Thermomicrobiales bacterium]|nr:hypothetical protein [Thermomicrobiales bacterium]
MMAGADAVAFYKQYKGFGFDIQVCTNALDELFAASAPEVTGAISNQSYFMTLDTPTNQQFIAAYQAKFGANARVDAIGEATYDAVHLYARAVEQAGTTDVDPVVEAMGQVEFDAPQGNVRISPENHHMIANSIIGRANEQGLFDIIENFGQIPPKLEGCNLTG